MKFYSSNRKSASVNFKEATINGQAPDKGLYFPENIPVLSESFIKNINDYSNEAIAYEVIQPYVADSIPGDILKRIVSETVNFLIPLVAINESISSLELFHGPTLAFKDIGARFMSRCLGYFVKQQSKKVTVLVATSGDTGGAVANGFYDVPGVEVVILYPSGKVSNVQEKQLTTLGKNIHALEVKGNFDDCQRMVKEVFTDAAQFPHLFLTSANSINVARWLPQQFYYFFAYKQWADKDNPPVISVPSGNFGNICAGLLAKASGLPVTHFIAACNANDTIPEYLMTEKYPEKASIATLSNAMDVANPSNFVRIMELFEQQLPLLKKHLSAVSVSDETTRSTLKRIFEQQQYLLDPHGAVGYYALEAYLNQHPTLKGLLLETAHPVKFYDVVEPIIGTVIKRPLLIREQLTLTKQALLIDNNTVALKEYLSNNLS
ncbi:MAG: threonine synthase [Chitinophagaceae bacterium]|nr:MAG: threonine synthase [Chitinophagaceae bacterium]